VRVSVLQHAQTNVVITAFGTIRPHVLGLADMKWVIFWLFLHILAAVVAFGPTFVFPIVGRSRRACRST
jgi:uncharacterized protein Smg (DUF494 family)